MTRIFTILFLIVCFLGFSQKIKFKDGTIFVNKVEYIKLREDKISKKCYIISNLKGEDLLYLRLTNYYDPVEVKPTTPGHYSDGLVYYYEVLSADLNTIYFENRSSGSMFNSLYVENAILNIYNGEVINSEGKLDITKLEFLSKKIGFEFSKKRDVINNQKNNNSNQTIIINNNQTPQRSGVNINLGK